MSPRATCFRAMGKRNAGEWHACQITNLMGPPSGGSTYIQIKPPTLWGGGFLMLKFGGGARMLDIYLTLKVACSITGICAMVVFALLRIIDHFRK